MEDDGWGCNNGAGGGWGVAAAEEVPKVPVWVSARDAGGWGGNFRAPAAAEAPDEAGWGSAAPKRNGDDWGAPPKRPAEVGGRLGKATPLGDGGDWGAPPKRPSEDGRGWGKSTPKGDGGECGAFSKGPAEGGAWGKATPQGGGDDWGAISKGPAEDEGGWGKATPQGGGDDWGTILKGRAEDEGGWGRDTPQGGGGDWGAISKKPDEDGGAWGKDTNGDGNDWGAPSKRRADDGPGWEDGGEAKRPRNKDVESDRLPDYLELACPDDFVCKQISIPPGAAGAIIGRGGATIKALRASIPGFVQIKLDKGVNMVEVTSDSVAAVEKVESFIESVVARIHSRNFRPDVSISCFQVADGASRLVLQLLPRNARARCLPEFLSQTKEVFFYQSCMPDFTPQEGGESPTSPLPSVAGSKDAKPPVGDKEGTQRGSGKVVCLDWLGGQRETLLPEFAEILKAAASAYKRGTRLKVQAQIAKNFFRGLEEKPSISATAAELEDMLGLGNLTLQSSSAYEEESIAVARALLVKLGFEQLPIDRKVSVHFMNQETKYKHTLSLPDDRCGPDDRVFAVRREIERVLLCTDYFQVLGLPSDKPCDAGDITRAYRRVTLLVHADESSTDAVTTVITRVVNEAYCCLMDPERQSGHRDSLPRQEVLCSIDEAQKQKEAQPKFKKNYGRHAFFSFLREGSGGDFRVMVKTRPSCPESSEPIPDEDATEMVEIVKEAVSQRSEEGLLRFSNTEKKHAVKVVRHKAVELFFNEDYKVMLKKVQMEQVGGESLSRWEISLVSLSLKEAFEGEIQTEAVAAYLGGLISLATQLTEGMGAIVCLQEIQQGTEAGPEESANLPAVDVNQD